MDLLEIKNNVINKVSDEAKNLNLDLSGVLSRISDAIDIIIDANRRDVDVYYNGLSDLDEYNFYLSTDTKKFVFEICTLDSPINLVDGGGKYMYNFLSLADNITITTEPRGDNEASRYFIVVIRLTFNF